MAEKFSRGMDLACSISTQALVFAGFATTITLMFLSATASMALPASLKMAVFLAIRSERCMPASLGNPPIMKAYCTPLKASMPTQLLVMPIPSKKKTASTLHQRIGTVVQLHRHTLQLAHAGLNVVKNQINGLVRKGESQLANLFLSEHISVALLHYYATPSKPTIMGRIA